MSYGRLIKHLLGATSLSVALLGYNIGAFAAGGTLGPGGGAASTGDYSAAPPLAVQGADPFLMIDMSVELTQQAEAFTDGPQTYTGGTVCTGRLGNQTTPWGTKEFGICYTPAEKYIGYFDSEKCYTYDAGDGVTTWAQQAKGPYPGNGLASTLNASPATHLGTPVISFSCTS